MRLFTSDVCPSCVLIRQQSVPRKIFKFSCSPYIIIYLNNKPTLLGFIVEYDSTALYQKGFFLPDSHWKSPVFSYFIFLIPASAIL